MGQIFQVLAHLARCVARLYCGRATLCLCLSMCIFFVHAFVCLRGCVWLWVCVCVRLCVLCLRVQYLCLRIRFVSLTCWEFMLRTPCTSKRLFLQWRNLMFFDHMTSFHSGICAHTHQRETNTRTTSDLNALIETPWHIRTHDTYLFRSVKKSKILFFDLSPCSNNINSWLNTKMFSRPISILVFVDLKEFRPDARVFCLGGSEIEEMCGSLTLLMENFSKNSHSTWRDALIGMNRSVQPKTVYLFAIKSYLQKNFFWGAFFVATIVLALTRLNRDSHFHSHTYVQTHSYRHTHTHTQTHTITVLTYDVYQCVFRFLQCFTVCRLMRSELSNFAKISNKNFENKQVFAMRGILYF